MSLTFANTFHLHFMNGIKFFYRFSRLPELIGFLITVWAAQKPFLDPFISLLQLKCPFYVQIYQTFPQAIVKPNICWIAYGFFLNDAADIPPQVSSDFLMKPSRSLIFRLTSSIFSAPLEQIFCVA